MGCWGGPLWRGEPSTANSGWLASARGWPLSVDLWLISRGVHTPRKGRVSSYTLRCGETAHRVSPTPRAGHDVVPPPLLTGSKWEWEQESLTKNPCKFSIHPRRNVCHLHIPAGEGRTARIAKLVGTYMGNYFFCSETKVLGTGLLSDIASPRYHRTVPIFFHPTDGVGVLC